MRINGSFATERKSEIKNYKPKYFIVSEGSNSEPLYFDGLNNSVISQNIDIINILRDFATINNSHPNFIVKMVKEFIINVKFNEITVLELRNRIDNFIRENNYNIDINDIYNKLLSIYGKDNYRIKNFELEGLFLKIFKGDVYKDLASNFPLYFETQNVTYSSVVDKINIVIDRDEQNFKDFQYDEVVKFCKNNNVNLYVSNPTFEFWLMLHFPQVLSDDKTKMYENRYVSRYRRYLEKRLGEICKYKKSKLDFTIFSPYVDDAIKREKMFKEDIVSLKSELGSNVGLLVSEMINYKKNNLE